MGDIHTRRARGGRVSPSTRSFLDEARRTPAFSLLDFLHGYVYCRWPYLYIAIGTGEHWLAPLAKPLARIIGLLSPSSSVVLLYMITFMKAGLDVPPANTPVPLSLTVQFWISVEEFRSSIP